MIAALCAGQTDLTDGEIARLEELARQLPLMAELTGADVFIDCVTRDGRALVVAQGSPSTVGSSYARSVVGQYALPEREPAVFHAYQLAAPVRDIKAITQEDRTVCQDVVPVLGETGRCIGLLIRETDISDDLLQEKKFQHLAQTYQTEDRSLRAGSGPDQDTAALREVHHRVKNNLQLVASILNLQARRCRQEETKKILLENVGRVLSISAIHDILTKNAEGSRRIDSLALLEQLRRNLQTLVPAERPVAITVTGDPVPLPADTAGSVALVVNELVTNALEHAFPQGTAGQVSISFCAGQLFHTVTVADNGVGFDVTAPRTGSLGLAIVEATVRDKLRGQLHIQSGPAGTRSSFSIKTE